MQSGNAVAIAPRARVVAPLSLRWLGIDFRSLLPWKFGRLTVEYGSLEELLPFLSQHYAALFGTHSDQRWRGESFEGNKRRFIEDSDIFLIRGSDCIVGYLVGNPSDWSTYYLRSMGLLPEHRAQGTYPLLLERVSDVLQDAGIDRIEGDIVPLNKMHILAATRLGFVPTGTTNSDRFGSLLRMTKFLRAEAEDVFHVQFCAGTWPRRRLTTDTGPERRSA